MHLNPFETGLRANINRRVKALDLVTVTEKFVTNVSKD
jgi:hypothetical protein